MSEHKGDTSKGAKYIAEHPTEFGYSWGSDPVRGRLSKNGDLVELRKDAPRIVVEPEQVRLFVETFGTALVSKAMNGTSIDVSCERIARDTLIDDRSVTNAQLREKMVSSILLGVITRAGGTRTKWIVAGVAYDSEEAAMAASKNGAESTPESETEKAAAFLAMCQENGVPAEVARNMAKLQFPNAQGL